MRKFYEAWMLLDANSSVATDEFTTTQTLFEEADKSTIANVEIGKNKSTIANVEFPYLSTIDIYDPAQVIFTEASPKLQSSIFEPSVCQKVR